MRFSLILLSLGLAHMALGNPKVGRNVVLFAEDVDVKIQGDTAQVHGAFRFARVYSRDPKAPDDERVYFPLVVRKDDRATEADFEFNLELNDQAALSYSIAPKPPVDVPVSDAYSVVWIQAVFLSPRIGDGLRIRVSYKQKLLDGVFYYLPIVEKTRPSSEGLEIRVHADRPIQSTSKGVGGVMSLRPNELVFIPAHLNMIAVSAPPP